MNTSELNSLYGSFHVNLGYSLESGLLSHDLIPSLDFFHTGGDQIIVDTFFFWVLGSLPWTSGLHFFRSGNGVQTVIFSFSVSHAYY